MKIIGKFLKVLSIVLLFIPLFLLSNYGLDRIENKLYGVKYCDQPITYTIGTFDERFKISRNEFNLAIGQAAASWSDPIRKKLFSEDLRGKLRINLIYDHRQEATDKLKSLGIEINDDKKTYESLKSKYETSYIVYDQEKASLTGLINDYENKQTVYEQAVNLANSRGGAKPAEYKKFEQDRNNLNQAASIINELQGKINKEVDEINALATVMNQLINNLNLNVNSYNTIGAETGREFAAGDYVSDESSQSINVYQFDSRDKLVRVLTHELGHALGLDHTYNSDDLMYKLNQGGNNDLSKNDLAQLYERCALLKN